MVRAITSVIFKVHNHAVMAEKQREKFLLCDCTIYCVKFIVRWSIKGLAK